MNFGLTEDQEMMRDTFARYFTEHSSMERVRSAEPLGFDQSMWQGLAELGAFTIRVPEQQGGLGLGTFDASLLMEEVGRTLASGPVAETILAARLLAILGGETQAELLEEVVTGARVATLAFRDIVAHPSQWVAGGAVAGIIVARRGDEVVLITVSEADRQRVDNLASTPILEMDLSTCTAKVLAKGEASIKAFSQALEEWKVLTAIALTGLSREAIRLASAYACERVQFDQLIGMYQAISHPLADCIVNIDAGKYLGWKTILDIANHTVDAAAQVSLLLWWAAATATRAVAQSLHTFGGYGLTTEYDIYLYNLRAKAWPLVFGDPIRLLEEAGRRLYSEEGAELPDVGEIHIDFDLGEAAAQLGKETDEFFIKHLTPELKAKAHYSFDGHDAGIHKKLAEERLLFPAWPKALGGREVEPYARSAAMHMWEKHGWTSHAVSVANMVGIIINRFGTDELKQQALSKIAAGEAICSLGYSEPASGSDVFAAKTRATPTEGGWRIDGQKIFTSGANIADYVLMLARTNTDGPKHKGLTMFIVPLKTEGVTIQPVYTFQDERTNITFYDGVEIPDSYRLGEVDGGLQVMAASLELEHGGGFGSVQAKMLLAAENLCKAINYEGRSLIEDVSAQTRLARTKAHVLISEVLANRSLWVSVEKQPNHGYGPMSKLFSSEKFLHDAADLLDLTAPYSLSKQDGDAGFLNQSYRHAQGTTIYGGTSEIHRSMIAERALGLPRTRK